MIVYLEMHGQSISVMQGETKVGKFDDIPSALRRMADIIEEHQKKERKSK
jgi:hypothetical protein